MSSHRRRFKTVLTMGIMGACLIVYLLVKPDASEPNRSLNPIFVTQMFADSVEQNEYSIRRFSTHEVQTWRDFADGADIERKQRLYLETAEVYVPSKVIGKDITELADLEPVLVSANSQVYLTARDLRKIVGLD